MSSGFCYLNGLVAGTYHGLAKHPDNTGPLDQVVVTVQLKQSRPSAPLVSGVLWCGAGEDGERRAADVRRVLARNLTASLVGLAVTYCAKSNSINVRSLVAVNVVTQGGAVVIFESLRPETTETTTTP